MYLTNMNKGKLKEPVEGVPWSMEFTVPGRQVPLVRKKVKRVKKLFNVDLQLSDCFEREGVKMQWIHLMGGQASAEEMQKAKSYVVSMSNPDACVSLEHFSASAFNAAIDEVESSTSAFLQLKGNTVEIKGSELAVVLAQSMLEDIQQGSPDKENSSEHSDLKVSNIPSCSSDSNRLVASNPPVSNSLQTLSLSTSQQMVPPSTTHQSPSQSTSHQTSALTVDSSSPDSDTTAIKKVYADDYYDPIVSASSSYSSNYGPSQRVAVINNYKSRECVSADNICSGDTQRDYLTKVGLERNFDPHIIQEALKCCDMNEIVRPVDFIEILSLIRSSGQGVPKRKTTPGDSVSHQSVVSVSPSPSSSSICIIEDESDTSVIVMDSDNENDDEEEEEEEEAIIISSDEENNQAVQGAGVGNAKKKKKKKKVSPPVPLSDNSKRRKNNLPGPSTSKPVSSLGSGQSEPDISRGMIPPIPVRSLGVSRSAQVASLGVNHTGAGQSSHKDQSEPVGRIVPQCLAVSRPIGKEGEKRLLRYVVIDGSNVAMSHGESKVFSVRGIQICMEYFLSRGHQVTAFVSESRRYSQSYRRMPISGRQLLELLNEEGNLKFTPARRMVTGQVISCYDDRFILNLAEAKDGIVVSNDQYRDLLFVKPTYREIIEKRLLPYVFVGDEFMPPDDPLGQHGPSLEEFLSKPSPPMEGASATPALRGPHNAPALRGPHNAPALRGPHNAPALRGPHNAPALRGPHNFPALRAHHPQALAAGPPGSSSQTSFAPPKLQRNAWEPTKTFQDIWNPKETTENQQAESVGDDMTDGLLNHQNIISHLPGRTPAQSQELYSMLTTMFVEEEQQPRLWAILHNHPEETDITRLSNYFLNAFST